MKKYKYVRLGFSGDSVEVNGKLLHVSLSPFSNDLNRLLEEGWHPVRETVMNWNCWGFFRKQSYPYVLILLEKEVNPSGDTGIVRAP
jgi:hypothetical protein